MERLLFTGRSGFIGRNIFESLKSVYDVTTIGRSSCNDVIADITDEIPPFKHRFDIVLHAAGKAHTVPTNENESKAFFDVNFQGTKNLCKSLEAAGMPRAFVYVSSVAVYGCETGIMIDESHPLRGTSPYARSKIMAEEFLTEWCMSHNVTLTILRPALIAGIDPPGNLGDMIRGIKKGFYMNIGSGKAAKSMLMAEDLAVILDKAKYKGGVYNLCDSHHPSFGELSHSIALQLGRHRPFSLPYRAAWIIAKVGDLAGHRFPLNSARLAKLVQPLTFSNRKARETFGWTPMSVIDHFRVNPTVKNQ